MVDMDGADVSTRLVGLTIPSLFAGRIEQENTLDEAVAETSLAWQKIGDEASFQEMAAVAKRVEPGRVITIFGRIAAAGEQLGLAGTAYRDARAWLGQDASEDRVRLPARALAEITGYYAISTAHGLANIAARLLALESRSRAALAKSFSKSNGFAPFDPQQDHWIALNTHSVQALEGAVDHHREARELVRLLRVLVEDERWTRLAERRNIDFHRWRPQSINGGVATSTPWVDYGDYSVLTVYEGETLQPDDHRALIAEAEAALEVLEFTMRTWAAVFPTALSEVCVYVLAEAMGGELLDRDRDEPMDSDA